MPRVGKNIYKRKDGRWEGRYIKCRINGKAKYASVYGHTCEETKQKLIKAKRIQLKNSKLNPRATRNNKFYLDCKIPCLILSSHYSMFVCISH